MTTTKTQLLGNYPAYAQMRATAPVFYHADQQTWLVYRFDEVKRVASEPLNFSSRLPAGLMSKEQMLTDALVQLDPPDHTKLRAIVSKAFTPAVMAKMEANVRKIAHATIDRVVESGRMDVIADLAVLLPLQVIAEMLGLPWSDRLQIKHWSDAIMEATNNLLAGDFGRKEHLVEAFRGMRAYVAEIAALRRAEPQEDLITRLAFAEVDGEHLTEADLVEFCIMLMAGGHETTTNLIGNAIYTLLEHPDQLAMLQSQPELIPQAIEEVLRFRAPIQTLFRTVIQDVELGGHQIRKGERVVAFIGSANRDESKYEDAERFDITRPPGQPMSFGHGIHFCLGAPLARLEGRVALSVLLERLTHLRIDPQAELELVTNQVVYGLASLPILFTPRS